MLSSYTRGVDFLAEALQNATDAIDQRTAQEPGAPRRILVTFDRKAGRFSVADTGVGMSREDLEIVLTPNVSLKSGRLDRSAGRSRGYKGVGLSFLALAGNYLQIRSCDRHNRFDIVVQNGNRWLASENAPIEKPLARGTRNRADSYLGSDRYTVVTVGDINGDDFDEDIFAYDLGRLVWTLRTKTAVGNTAPLWREPFGAQLSADEEIDVRVRYIGADGREEPEQSVPYRYATPEEFVLPGRIRDFDDLAGIEDNEEVSRQLAGAALRYRRRLKSPGGTAVWMYVFAMDAREFAVHREARGQRGEYTPNEWQGFYVATRDMPANIAFAPERIQPRTYERRMFALLQYDDLMLDLGRKTLVGRTLRMFRDIVHSAWLTPLARFVGLLQPLTPDDPSPDTATLDARIAAARQVKPLDADVPYLSEPRRVAAVLALFHEIVGARKLLPELRTLETGVLTEDRDGLLYLGSPNGAPPLRVVFGRALEDVVTVLERDEPGSNVIGLAVVWEIGAIPPGSDLKRTTNDPHGATHTLDMHRRLNVGELPVISMNDLLGTGAAT